MAQTTMTQIAKSAGVSVALVSRVLRGDKTLRISDDRRGAILAAREKLGGVMVRRSGHKLTRTIILVANQIFRNSFGDNIASSKLLSSFREHLENNGFRFLIQYFEGSEEKATYDRLCISRKECDGILLPYGPLEWLAQMVLQYKLPHISFDQTAERYEVNTVAGNGSMGIRLAVEHLRDLGHRRIGYLGPERLSRFANMVAYLTEMRLPVDANRFRFVIRSAENQRNPEWRDLGREAFRQWVNQGLDATALICSNDWMAMGVVDIMKEKGLTPGRDLSIVGYDNLEVQEGWAPEHPILTTVHNPFEQVGRRGATLLLNQILHRQTEIVHERIPIKFIVRETTGPAPEASPLAGPPR